MALHDGAEFVGVLLFQISRPIHSLTNLQKLKHFMEGMFHGGKGSDFRGDR